MFMNPDMKEEIPILLEYYLMLKRMMVAGILTVYQKNIL